MSKKEKTTDYVDKLEKEYARWNELFTKGGSDPFWSDGVNLELVRNHILYYKDQLAKQDNSLLGLPDVYYRETPPVVDRNYMACPDEIRRNARKAMCIIDADENLKFVREQSKNLPENQLEHLCIPAIIRYAENIRRAIAEDDLITMRRYKHFEHYLDSFRSAAEKLRSPRNINEQPAFYEDENEEEFEEEFKECSETEQQNDKVIPEIVSELNRYTQLTFF